MCDNIYIVGSFSEIKCGFVFSTEDVDEKFKLLVDEKIKACESGIYPRIKFDQDYSN